MRSTEDLPCREFVELITEYLEDTLPAELCQCIEAHLEVCDGCRLYLGQIRLTVRTLRQPRDGHLAPEIRGELLRRFRIWQMQAHPGDSPLPRDVP